MYQILHNIDIWHVTEKLGTLLICKVICYDILSYFLQNIVIESLKYIVTESVTSVSILLENNTINNNTLLPDIKEVVYKSKNIYA